MMKKCLILYLFILFTTNLFANGKTENLIRIIENSDLWCFDKEQAIKEGKNYIKLTYQTATDFRNETRNNLNSDLYPNKKKMTYDDLKTVFKSCNSLMFGRSYSTVGEYSSDIFVWLHLCFVKIIKIMHYVETSHLEKFKKF